MLTPVMALLFPAETSVALTAVVHFANNLFKLALFGRAANLGVCLRFGIPALLASLTGAWVLVQVAHLEPLWTPTIFGRTLAVTPVKLLVGALLAYFALRELRPGEKPAPHPASWLPLGGLVSGFFGGLSGNQGAFRSAFLLGAGLSKEAFIATGVVLACVVDASRLAVYAGLAGSEMVANHAGLLVAASLSAFLGAFFGGWLLKKMTIQTVRRVVGVMLLLLAAGLIVGIL